MRFVAWVLEKLFSKADLFYLEKLIRAALTKRLPHSERVGLFYNRQSPRFKFWHPPGRPSKEDISIYREFLPKLTPTSQVIILGSTPELRDLLSEAGIKNYIVADITFSMIVKCLELCKRANPANEVWIKCAWQFLPLPKNHFDFIVGDFVLWQLLPGEESQFLEKVASLLRPGGSFVTRTHIVNPQVFKYTPEEIIRSFLEKLYTGNEAELRSLSILTRLRDRLRDKQSQITKVEDMIKVIRNYRSQNEKERKFLKKAVDFLKMRSLNNAEYTTHSEEEVETLLKNYFRIISKKSATYYEDGQFFPIYCLERADSV